MTLSADGLGISLGGRPALRDVSLRCGAGEIVGVFGPSAAGKTTLMHAVSGVLVDRQAAAQRSGGGAIAIAGRVTLGGEDLTALGAVARARRGVVLCPERRGIFPDSSALENLKIGAHLASRAQAADRLELVFSIFPALAPQSVRRRRGRSLSGGEQHMVAIGRALMAGPRVLLLDEPLLSVRRLMYDSMVQALARIRTETGIAMLIAEQYAGAMLGIIDRGYVLDRGAVVAEGPRDELRVDVDAWFGASAR